MKYTNEHAVTAGIFLLKDGGRLYGFAKPTGPPSTEILRGNVYPLLFCILFSYGPP